jgi:hypothetical protein
MHPSAADVDKLSYTWDAMYGRELWGKISERNLGICITNISIVAMYSKHVPPVKTFCVVSGGLKVTVP